MADDTIITNNQYLGSGEVDSLGNLLPGNFGFYESNNAYTWGGTGGKFPLTKVETKTITGLGTYKRTSTYTNDGLNVTGRSVSGWVKQ